MQNFFNTEGSKTFNTLLADPIGAEKGAIALAPGNGDLAEGTLVVKNATSGLYEPATALNLVAGSQAAILDAPASTGAEAEGIAVNAPVWVKGIFLKGKVKLVSGSLTAAMVGVLNGQGIRLKAYVPLTGAATEVENEVAAG